MRIKHRTLLRTKELRQLLKTLKNTPNLLHQTLVDSSPTKVQVERIILDNKWELYLIHEELWLIIQKDRIIPGLPALLSGNLRLPQVIVDMGAIPHITNGADVMTPGIVDIEDQIVEGDLVVILDINNQTPLAVGQMHFDAHSVKLMDKGRAIETLHYVGDPLWKLIKELSE